MKVHFNLKQTSRRDEKTQVMLVVTLQGTRCRIYTRQRVEPRHWNPERQECNPTIAQTAREWNELSAINNRLRHIRSCVSQADRAAASQGRPTTAEDIRTAVTESLKQKKATVNVLDYFAQLIENYASSINRRGTKGISSSSTAYNTALKRLEAYCAERGRSLESFDELGKAFFDDFTNYLSTCTFVHHGEKKHYSRITIVNTVMVIKNLLHRAYDNGMTDNESFLRVDCTVTASTNDKIYLTEAEIARFSKVQTNNKRETDVRDMFVIACYTALRISDINQLTPKAIKRQEITLVQQKTKEPVTIPILKEISNLVEAYCKEGFPRLIPNITNEMLKKLARRARITDRVTYRENRGGRMETKHKEKCDLVTFHTARRSCITNLYRRGYPSNYIMTLSGHRSIQAFQRYVRATQTELSNDFMKLLRKNKAL